MAKNKNKIDIEDQKVNILVIQGTSREKRKSIHAARLVKKVGRDLEGVSIKFADPVDFNFPGDGNDEEAKNPEYTKLTVWADAFFIVVPEYNHGYPGSLKRMLDSELKNYIHKPVAFAGVSGGPWGGTRAIEALVPAVREMGMVATFTDVNFAKINDVFDKNGNLQDEAYVDRVKRTYEELIWMAKAMKYARNCLPSKHHERDCEIYKK